MDKQRKSSTFASLVLHVIVIWSAFSIKNAHIIIPSRSNGMEVSLITPEELKSMDSPSKIVTQLSNEQNIQAADINFKVTQKPTPIVEKPHPTTLPSPLAKIPPKTLDNPAKAKTVHAIKKKSPANNAVNDLLNNLTPSQNAGKSKNSAVGGTDSGTSSSDNLVANYADKVIAAVRPYVEIPNDINNNNIAVVEVILLPNLQPYSIRLLKSSGNLTYDNNIISAINKVGTFPELPDGASFTEYRKLRLTFRPE